MKRIIAYLLCALMLLACAGCGGSAAPAAQEGGTLKSGAAAAQTPVSTPEEGRDSQTTEAVSAVKPTPEPTAAPEQSLLQRAVGIWKLYSSEVEGDYHETAETGIYQFLTVREDGSLDYYSTDRWFEADREEGIPLRETERGLEFTRNTTGYEDEYTILSVEGDRLELCAIYRYDETQRAASDQIYLRSDAEAMAKAPVSLTETEINEINKSWDRRDYGFFLSTYSRPEELDWSQVLYCGGGIAIEPTQELRDAYEREIGGEVELDLEVIRAEDLKDLALRKTGVPYELARNPLWYWTYLWEEDVYCFQHGDTNAENIIFDFGWREGDELVLGFERSDWQTYRDERSFYARVRELPTRTWQYIAVWPQEAREPRELLRIEYSMEQPAADHTWNTKAYDSDEPDAWRWALLTATEDGVAVSVDRAVAANGNESALCTGMGAPHLNENVWNGSLNAGETLAVRVVLGWCPTMRVSAVGGGLWGSYWFGSDNGLHLDDVLEEAASRWVMGHDLVGEGRGALPWSEEDLADFLRPVSDYDEWLWLDEDGNAAAYFLFFDYRALEIIMPQESYMIFLTYDHLYNDRYMAPDLLEMEKYYRDDSAWDTLPEGYFPYEGLGDYLIDIQQFEGEQQLILNQANNGDGVLAYILGTDLDCHTFVLHRPVGTLTDGNYFG